MQSFGGSRYSTAAMQTPEQTTGKGRPIAEAPLTSQPKTGFEVLKDEFKTQTHEDPIFRYIAESWRQILVGVLIVVAVLYARRAFIETQDQDARRSADALSKVQAQLDRYVSLKSSPPPIDPKLSKEEQDKILKAHSDQLTEISSQLNQAITSLGDTRAPYQTLAPIYRAIAAKEEGNTQKALSELSLVDPFASDPTADPAGRLVGELSAILRARILLDQSGKENEGREIMKTLGEKGSFVRVPAALSLALLANSPEDKAQALSILEAIVRDEPSQEPLLSSAIERLRG